MSDKYITGKIVKEPLHLGNGQLSMAAQYELHQKLEEAFSIMSETQQPAHPSNALEVREENERLLRGQDEIKQITAKIVLALTGGIIKFEEK